MILSLTFRKAVAADIPSLVAIENDAFPDSKYDRYRYKGEDFAALIDGGPVDVIVAETPGSGIAGYIAINRAPEDKSNPNIDSIAVSANCRARGVGRALLAEAEKLSWRGDYRALSLDVHEDNAAAIELYRSSGYSETGRAPEFYDDGRAALRFTKQLIPVHDANMVPGQLSRRFNGIVRPARETDLAAIMAIENSCFTSEKYSEKTIGRFLERSLEDPETSLLLAFESAAAEASGNAAGYALSGMDDDETGHLRSMAVMEESRKQGIGRVLLDRVCDSLRQAGAQKIILEARTENAAAIQLYSRRGFEKTRDLPDCYGAGQHGIEMALDF